MAEHDRDEHDRDEHDRDERDIDAGGCCVIITGPPGAGKTTIARAVAEGLGRSACIDADFVTRLTVSGWVWALGEPADEAARQVSLLLRNLSSLASNYADAGFTPVIDTVLPDRGQLDALLEGISPRRVLLVVLCPSIQECRERNEHRPVEQQFFFDGYEGLYASMREGFGDVGWWLDTTGESVEGTTRRILQEAAARAVVGPAVHGSEIPAT